MASVRAPWALHGQGASAGAYKPQGRQQPTAVAATLSGGDLASEVHRLRGAARFHHQELNELAGRARVLLARSQRLDATLGRLSAIMLGASLPSVAAGSLMHLGGLLQAGMLMTALGTVGTCIWTLGRQSLHSQGERLETERRAAQERADNCERLARALDPRARAPQADADLDDDERTDHEITQKTQVL